VSNEIFVWPEPIRIGDAARFTPSSPLIRQLSADETARKRIAKALGLLALDQLDAELALSGWFDGLQIEGRWRARVTQACVLTLEPFPADLAGDFRLRLVPVGSPHAMIVEEEEIEVDLEADDPPDIVESDLVDLGAYVVEHLALEIDPFPRKPDAVFEPPQPTAEISPFAALRDWKRPAPSGDGPEET